VTSPGGVTTSFHPFAVTLQHNATKLGTERRLARTARIASKDFTHRSQLGASSCAKCAARHRHGRRHKNRLFSALCDMCEASRDRFSLGVATAPITPAQFCDGMKFDTRRFT